MPRQMFMSLSFVRARLAVAALAIAMLLSGCQGGTTPASPASPTGSTTATPTTSAASPLAPSGSAATSSAPAVYKPADAQGKAQNVPVPAMPELAKENSKAGLEAFIGYWFQLLSYAYETGDSTMSRDFSSPTCALCQHLAKSVEANYTAGRWLSGGTFQTPVVEVSWDPKTSTQQGKLQVIQQEIRYFEANGIEGRGITAATNDAAAIFADYRDGSWLTTDVGIIR